MNHPVLSRSDEAQAVPTEVSVREFFRIKYWLADRLPRAHLPDASGFDIVSRMLAGSVALISTHDRQDYADLISRSGARGFLSKDQLCGATLEALVAEG